MTGHAINEPAYRKALSGPVDVQPSNATAGEQNPTRHLKQ